MTDFSSYDIISDMADTILDQILHSKPKTKLVTFFLANPERSFYVGELEKRLGSRTLSSHLSALVKMNLLKVFTKKGKRYYIVNRKNDFWDRSRSSLSKSLKRYEDELIRAIKKISSLKVAILSGIFVARPELNCDLLLVGKIPERKLEKFIDAAEKMIGQELNFALFDAKEYQYRKNIFDRFTKDIFENPHLMVVDKIK